jgi:hypothetical protein
MPHPYLVFLWLLKFGSLNTQTVTARVPALSEKILKQRRLARQAARRRSRVAGVQVLDGDEEQPDEDGGMCLCSYWCEFPEFFILYFGFILSTNQYFFSSRVFIIR